MLAVLVGGCMVQLTAPFDASIGADAAELQQDFYVFAGTMQTEAGTADGYYTNHAKDYVGFEARLATTRFRAENDPGGLPCGKTLQAIRKANAAALDRIDPQARQQMESVQGPDTCITILARLAEQQMESLRQLHEDGCKPVGAGRAAHPDPHCQAIFGRPPLFDVIGSATSTAPAVSAVSISINELVRQEQILKPQPNS